MKHEPEQSSAKVARAEYSPRNLRDLEPHYSRHVAAMTAEGLHAKSDIAAELAARDAQIEALRAALAPFALRYEGQEDDRDVLRCQFSCGTFRRAAKAMIDSSRAGGTKVRQSVELFLDLLGVVVLVFALGLGITALGDAFFGGPRRKP